MVASRNKPEGGLRTSLWLGVMMLLALPSEVGYQDLATLLTRQPVVNRAQKTAFASTFGTIHEAPYNLPEPVGASIPIPPGYMLAGLDAGHADVTASLRDRLFGAERDFPANPYAGPVIDRTRKGDYGVAAKDDRRVALKGDRLKVRPAGEAVPGAGEPAQEPKQGPALAQQPSPAPALVQEPPAEVAAAEARHAGGGPAGRATAEISRAGSYSLASTGDLSRRRPWFEVVRREIRLSHACAAARRRQGGRTGRRGRRTRGRGTQAVHDRSGPGPDRRRSDAARRAALLRRGSHGTTARSDRAVGARRGTRSSKPKA
jgi:hypothetical protein